MYILNIYSRTKYKKLFYIILDTTLESIQIPKLINIRFILSKNFSNNVQRKLALIYVVMQRWLLMV